MEETKLRKFREIIDEILEEKIIKKHEQYGESLENPIMIFNDFPDVQALIDIRLDDKLNRIRLLSMENPKYWSEIKEMISYMLWKIYLYENDHPWHPNDTINHAEEMSRMYQFKEGDFDLCRFCPYFEFKDEGGYCIRHNYYIGNNTPICFDAIEAREDYYDESCGCNCGYEGEPVKSSGDTSEVFEDSMGDSATWRLSSSGPYPLRKKEL